MAESRDDTAKDARASAQAEADIGLERIADVYAQGLFAAVEKAGKTAEIVEELDELIDGVLAAQPKLAAIFASALISPDEKAGILDRLFAARLTPLLLRFLKVVARHGRLDCLAAIHRRLHGIVDAAAGRVRVRVSTAEPLSAELAERITTRLRSVLGKEPVLDRVTDPKLIGGVVLRIEDTVYDDSIANQLQLIRQQMIDRSAHEIQSRRDRFRYPAGN